MDWNATFALWSLNLNCRLQSGKSNILIGRIRCDAILASAQDGKRTVMALDCRAAGAGLALVAYVRGVAEVNAAGPLQQIPSGRRHVAKLRGCAREQSLG